MCCQHCRSQSKFSSMAQDRPASAVKARERLQCSHLQRLDTLDTDIATSHWVHNWSLWWSTRTSHISFNYKSIRHRSISGSVIGDGISHSLGGRKYHWWTQSTSSRAKNSCLFSKTRRVVVQEVYGWLLGHWAVGSLIFQAATNAGIAPLRLSFTGTEASYSACALPYFNVWNQKNSLRHLPGWNIRATTRSDFFFSWLIVEILDTLLPERVHRINPRVVKKPVSKFRSKKVKHRGTGTPTHPFAFHIIRTA